MLNDFQCLALWEMRYFQGNKESHAYKANSQSISHHFKKKELIKNPKRNSVIFIFDSKNNSLS